MARGAAFGHARERAVRKIREAEGWFVVRAPGSLGIADLVCLKAGETPRLTEVKGTLKPYDTFPPARRRELLEAASKAGAIAELAHWPVRGKLRWIESESWPINTGGKQ